MSTADNKAVFLSYASQDAEAAKKICDALRAAGVEVWFDQNELTGGDQWDQKIRGQVKACTLFVPVISVATQARLEGYFRLEWKLAAQRTHTMADAKPFLLPVVIDDTHGADAHVPEEFRAVQWTRLPAGETPGKFCARVQNLLATGSSSRETTGHPTSQEPGPPRTRRRPSTWWWALPMFGMAMALLLVMKEGRRESSPTAPVPEVRQLIEQAQALINKPGAARDELEAAEKLCEKAAKLDPTDAEVLATWSQVCTWMVFHGFDASPERREAARFKAAQALQLAPGSYEARLAQACYLVRGGGVATIVPEADQADGLLQSLLRERPDEPRALLALGFRQSRSGHVVEARATLRRLAENPGFAPTAWGELGWLEMFAANYAEAEADVDRANALQPLWRNLILKLLLAVEWRGDLDLARATQMRLPESVRQEDVGVFTATYLCYLRHEPEQMLRTLDADPRDWFYTGGYIGPKAVWAALAQEQLGAKDRAAAQWQLALKFIERRLEERPDPNIQLLEAYVLAALERDADAEKTLRLVSDASKPEPLPWLRRDRYVVTQLRLGHPEAALDYLEKDPRLTAAVLQHEPRLDPLRGLSRFQALRERIEADPTRSPNAKTVAPIANPVASTAEFPRDPNLKRARKLIYAFDSIAGDFALADDLVKPLLTAQPNDPEVVTVAAEVSAEYLIRGFDNTPPRRAQAQRLAERAVQLAPDNPAALAALGRYLRYNKTQLARAEELLRRAIAIDPKEPRYYRVLYSVLILTKPGPDTEAFGARMAALFPHDPLVTYELAVVGMFAGDLAAAEAGLDQTLKLAPVANAITSKAKIMLEVHGDVEGMKLWLDRMPERQRTNARFASDCAVEALVTGQTAPAREVLDAITDTWLADGTYIFPKAMLIGDLDAIDRKDDVARLDYEAALDEIKRTLAADPTDLRPRRAELWVQFALGHREEALAALRVNLQRRPTPYRWNINLTWWSSSLRACLMLGQRAEAITQLKEAREEPQGRLLLRNLLRVDPKMAPFRDDPEIVALLKEPETDAKP